MSLSILRDIVEPIKNADFHSIMIDETTDASNKEHAVFCVRWVDENIFSYEDFFGLYEMQKTGTISKANFIKDIILRLAFDSKKLQGQYYDSCVTMMGKKRGVTTQIKNNIQLVALFIHCYAHLLNLTCVDWIRNVAVVSKSLDTSYKITKLLRFSPQRDLRLRKIHEEEYCKIEKKCSRKFTTLILFSGTRWTVRAAKYTKTTRN